MVKFTYTKVCVKPSARDIWYEDLFSSFVNHMGGNRKAVIAGCAVTLACGATTFCLIIRESYQTYRRDELAATHHEDSLKLAMEGLQLAAKQRREDLQLAAERRQEDLQLAAKLELKREAERQEDRKDQKEANSGLFNFLYNSVRGR